MPGRIFIDAMNVIRSNPSLARLEEKSGNRAAQLELIRLVRQYAERRDGTDCTLVFDGPATAAIEANPGRSTLIIYSEDEKADQVIIRLAQDAVALGYGTLIVSNDAEVRAEGANFMRAEQFYEILLRRPAPKNEISPEAEFYEQWFQSAASRAPEGLDEIARRLIATLVENRLLPASMIGDQRLKAELADLLKDCSAQRLSLPKVAKKLESFLATRSTAAPKPDPQKLTLRALKTILAKELKS